MSEAQRNAAFDQLETFYANNGIETVEFTTSMKDTDKVSYRMDSGGNKKQQNFKFAFNGWYYVYPLHYDAYTIGKGNDWIEQTAGWMIANANSVDANSDQQDGTYVYCTPEN